MNFTSDSRGPGRVIDRRGQPKPKGWKSFDGKYSVSEFAGRYDRGNASKLGLSAYSASSLRSASPWLGSVTPSRPGPSRKKHR